MEQTTKREPGYLLSQDRIGEKYGDMTITAVSSHKNQATGWTIPDYTVHCDVCDITRTVDGKGLLAGEGQKHGRGCVKAVTTNPDLVLGKTYGDMKVVGTDFYVQPNGKPENKFIVECQKCGQKHKTLIGPLLVLSDESFHEGYCVPKPKITDFSKYVGTKVGDMNILKFTKNESGNSAFLVRCDTCGVERMISASALLKGQGNKHGFACGYGNEHRYDHLVGTTQGDMTIEKAFKKDAWWYVHVRCKICGHEKDIRTDHLKDELGTSHASCTAKMYPRRFYKIYWGARYRCECETSNSYSGYGARGIKCEWKDLQSFANDMLESYLEACKIYGEHNVSLERLDVEGNYCKDNCKWIHIKDQQNNKRYTIYFRLVSPTGKVYCSRNLTGFCTAHNLVINSIKNMLYGNTQSYNGWTGTFITTDEYAKYWENYPSKHLEDAINILHDLYDKYKDDPDKQYEVGVRINYGLFSNMYANGDLCNEEIDVICNMPNNYGLKISFDSGRKCFYIDEDDEFCLAA